MELSESSIGFQKYFQLKEIEFQAVLDITVAINQNRPETGFYLLLENYLLEKLGIGHFSLFIREDDWKNSFSYGKVLQNSLAFNLADTPLNVSGFADFAPELALANPHLKHYIPFFFDRQKIGLGCTCIHTARLTGLATMIQELFGDACFAGISVGEEREIEEIHYLREELMMAVSKAAA